MIMKVGVLPVVPAGQGPCLWGSLLVGAPAGGGPCCWRSLLLRVLGGGVPGGDTLDPPPPPHLHLLRLCGGGGGGLDNTSCIWRPAEANICCKNKKNYYNRKYAINKKHLQLYPVPSAFLLHLGRIPCCANQENLL